MVGAPGRRRDDDARPARAGRRRAARPPPGRGPAVERGVARALQLLELDRRPGAALEGAERAAERVEAHRLPALLPVVTVLGLKIGWILGGAVTIEYVFARPGLGSLLITSLNQRDYPVVQGCLLMLSVAVLLGTLLGDVLQAAMDPRVRDRMT